MKRIIANTYVLILCLLAACATSSDNDGQLSSTHSTIKEEPIEPGQQIHSPHFTIKEGDFQFTLFSKKETYDANEEPEIYAELTYIGDNDRIDIGHGDPLIAFSLHEVTRNVQLNMSIREIFIMETLDKNKPVQKKFDFKNMLMSANDKTSEKFFDQIQRHGLPPGDYIITSHALFFVKDDKDYNLKGEIRFQIK